ncbi:alpha/beta-hydrolase [Calocera viscosa TUFC12733]|uniref:Alpha/beta-hydrolase n=1 Tax=Calocera viscosa (strain TUFC12733) TaxID=1330018 RepID=A0A167G9F3_CALVF|nr:alpha/beta-hydrolase [Calocera viscosa TUFC12733]
MRWNPHLPLRTRILLTLRLHFLLLLFRLFTLTDHASKYAHQLEVSYPSLSLSGAGDGERGERLRALWYEASDAEREWEGSASDLMASLLAKVGSPRPSPTGPPWKEGEEVKPKPVHINFHGSGFLFPALGSNHLFCTLLARQTGAIVLDCDYRKSPRGGQFPVAYEDARAALAFVLRNEEGRFDLRRVTVSGFSAGGALALALVGCLRGEWEGTVRGVQAFYPPTDCSVPFSKKPAPPPGPDGPLPRGDLELMRQAYLGDWPWEKTADPRLSSSFCEAGRFPGEGRTLLLSVEYDWLDAECRELGEKLRLAGREPVLRWEKGVGHGFDVFCREGTGESALRDEAYRLLVEVVRRAQEL